MFLICFHHWMTLKRKGRKEKYGGTSEGILIYREPKMVGGADQ